MKSYFKYFKEKPVLKINHFLKGIGTRHIFHTCGSLTLYSGINNNFSKCVYWVRNITVILDCLIK